MEKQLVENVYDYTLRKSKTSFTNDEHFLSNHFRNNLEINATNRSDKGESVTGAFRNQINKSKSSVSRA
jgi:hypothetical protein